jgi:hypothetical protein
MLLRYDGILGFGVQVCFLAIRNFGMAKDKICVIEIVNGIDEIFLDVSTIPFQSHNFLDVESVH